MSQPSTRDPRPFRVADHCLAEKARTEEAFARVVALAGEESWREALRVLRVLAGRVERHVRLAEDVLFPLFEVKAVGETGLTVELVANHRAMSQGLRGLDALLRENRLQDLPTCVRGLRGIVDEHDGRELRLLCPMLDRLLSEQELAFLGARLVGAGVRPEASGAVRPPRSPRGETARRAQVKDPRGAHG